MAENLTNNLKVGIHSLGLIGGSIYKNLMKQGGANIIVCSQNEYTIQQVQSYGTTASNDINILNDCDVIFVCTPISRTIDTIKNIYQINKTAIIIDVASLKENILSEVEKLDGIKFIGSHPMAGTENSGFNASMPELFENSIWVLTPSKYVSDYDVILIQSMISLMGAKPVIMNASEHDKAVSMISHTPMLIAQALMLSLSNKNELMLAASGFRDMTRLALSNKVMAKDMLLLNKENIKTSLQNIIDNAQKLLSSEFFDDNIDKIIKSRSALYNSSGKNNFKNND